MVFTGLYNAVVISSKVKNWLKRLKKIRMLTTASLALVTFLAGGGVMKAVSAEADYESLRRFSQILDLDLRLENVHIEKAPTDIIDVESAIVDLDLSRLHRF